MSHDDPDDLRAAEYVLGILPADDRFAFSGRMLRDPALRAKATFWAEHFNKIGAYTAPVAPPEGVFSEVNATLFGEAATAPERQLTRRVAAAVLGAACVWTLISPVFVRENLRENDFWAELSTDDGRIVAMAAYDPDTARLYVQRVQGAAAQSGIYQIWLIADGGAPVSLGVLPDSEQVKYRVARRDRNLMPRSVVAISQEVAGAKATRAPKGPIVAIDALTRR